MSVINILDSQSANMIAAGEVVERPASAVKELVENAIDAGAKTVSVELKGGGVAMIRVSDDGCGILAEDLPKAVLRHATSKIRCGTDIDGVTTLGFRGEALAAISAVSHLKIISRKEGEELGNLLSCEEGSTTLEEVGCPVGTTVLVEGLFYNTPARRKFLKKDMTESAACRAVVEKAAISHPHIAFKFISDGELKLSTTGNGSLPDAIGDTLGAAKAKDLVRVEGIAEQVTVSGYVSAPSAAVGRNTAQNTFVNGRYVISKTVQAAVKEAFKSYLPHDRYPVTVLFVEVPYKFVDVNVHPAKTEIKFADERLVYEAVFYGIRGALSRNDAFTGKEDDIFVSGGDVIPTAGKDEGFKRPVYTAPALKTERVLSAEEPKKDFNAAELGEEGFVPVKTMEAKVAAPSLKTVLDTPSIQKEISDSPKYRYVGELYDAYLIAETAEAVYIVDKHAAHERILYEEIRKSTKSQSQSLLVPDVVELSAADTALLLENKEYLYTMGFDLDAIGDNSIIVRALPVVIKGADSESLLSAFASALERGGALPIEEKCDRALFTMACKAALKAGIANDSAHNKWVLDKLFADGSIKYCPHGRPVAKMFIRREVNKWFDR